MHRLFQIKNGMNWWTKSSQAEGQLGAICLVCNEDKIWKNVLSVSQILIKPTGRTEKQESLHISYNWVFYFQIRTRIVSWGVGKGGGGGVDAQLKEIEPGSVIDRWQESGQISSKTWYEFRGKTQLVFRVRALTLPAKVMDWYVFKWPSRTLLQWERVNPKQNIQRICLELEDIKWGS